jgi:outer membrane receptor for ferrienterochelin and colicins
MHRTISKRQTLVGTHALGSGRAGGSKRKRTVRRGGPLAAAFLLTTTLWTAPRAFADDLGDLGDLESLLSEQIVTSASKQAEGASAAPALSTSLSSEDLRRYGIKTLAEAIDFLTIGAKSSENLNGKEIGARGVLLTGDHGSHFLLLVDGHAMNEPLRGSAWVGIGAGVPMELIDHIEVIVGPGSVLYGSNAMFGLINVVTKRAKDYAGLHLIAESSISTYHRFSAGYARKFSLWGKEGEVLAQAQYFKQGGPYLTFGPVNTGGDAFTGNPGRNTRDIEGTGVWGGTESTNAPFAEVPSAMLRLQYGNFELSARETHYTHSAPTGIGNYDDPDTRETEVRRSFDLKYHNTLTSILDMSARLYGDYFRFENHMIASRGSLCPYTSNFGPGTCDFRDKGTATWLGGELQTSWDWLKDARLVTMVGGDVRWRSMTTNHDKINVETQVTFLADSQKIPGLEASDVTVGTFLQQTYNPSDKLHFNAGLRLDRDSRFDMVLVKRISGNWEPWKNGLLKLSYAEAFRAPSWDESNDSAAGRIAANVVTTPNGMDAVAGRPDLNFGTPLKPETVRSVEAAVQQKQGTHRIMLGGFYSRWSNLVQLRQLSLAETNEAGRNSLTSPAARGTLMTQYQNANTIDNYGLNIGIDGSFAYETLQYGLTGTLAKAKVKTTAQDVAAGNTEIRRNGNIAPSVFGNARFAYVPGGNLPTIAVATHVMGSRPPDQYIYFADGTLAQPYAPAQVEGRLSVSGLVPKLTFLRYRLAVNYALADQGPYAVGPLMVVQDAPTQAFAQTPPVLIPVERFHLSVGLQMDF